MNQDGRVVALSGGIGGAKLALGLSRALDPRRLMIIANTGDDFRHLGLAISPDVDTLLYTLGGLADTKKGWGRRDETWTFMEALRALGGPTWFQLGDGDLAMHVERTRRLSSGEPLSQVTQSLAACLGVTSSVLPMSDDEVRTRLLTQDGWLDFQDYFVRLRCGPAISAIRFEGAEQARPAPGVLAALQDPGLRAVIVCPSNPLISIEPILAVPGIRAALRACTAPVIAVSPVIRGQAVKGPTVKMLSELGFATDTGEPARRYRDFLDGYVVDESEPAAPSIDGLQVEATATLMVTLADREHLAGFVLGLADRLRARAHSPEVHHG